MSLRRTLTALTAVAALALSGCALTTPSGPGSANVTDPAGKNPSSLVLADTLELGGFNPVSGYGELGTSPLYDGLLRLDSTGDDKLPALKPALAASEPTLEADHTTWRVKIRRGVTFHDGTTLGPEDVVATYRAILDPRSASPLASTLDMVAGVRADGDDVVFSLRYPYSDFPTRLLIGIAPSEKLTGGPSDESSLNTQPIGTGPYRLARLSPDEATFDANARYWDGVPQVSRLTVVRVADDNTRAQRLLAGDLDGAQLPPLLAHTFAGKDGWTEVAVKSADWRGVSLPKNSAFARDPAARMAMNLAVNRDAMVSQVLGGEGIPAFTPVSPVYGDAYDPGATFPFDRARAERLLDAAGWTKGTDGFRHKGADVARFTVAYRPTDIVRRDLATAFAADMRAIGVDVQLEGLDFAAIEPRREDLGILLGGGDKPYSLDSQLYGPLHTRVPGASTWDNPGDFSSPRLDAALERARRSTDAAERTAAYRAVQADYVEDPSYVMFAFLRHTYVMKDDGWQPGPSVTEPHSHGVSWGPWWNLAGWRRS
ncbi:ABC transporter substrate-binding protein [Nigerium massiliense]|uniref:ABC transporter substrate-binding protein n=1 Tax=Nigerium massiliense TaxID=1522317 RepID=UPI0005900141|nr:ABC transporter substrate-binding protein [Nigerium massiliense]